MSLQITEETTFLLDMLNISGLSILGDGNTEAWFDGAAVYIIKDGGNLVSQWTDRSGNANHLLQAVGGNQPLWSTDGVLFDGVDNFMKATFALAQPTFIYMVLKQVTWTSLDRFFDGVTSQVYIRQAGTTPDLVAYAGTPSAASSALVLDTFGIIRVLFNGASSKLIINDTTPIASDFGANDMGGINIGRFEGGSNYAHIQVKEIIIRTISDSPTNEAIIYDYLKDKYSL